MARWMGKFGGNPLLHRIIESCESTFILWVCILFLLVACFFFVCIITYFGHPMAKIQTPHWALARPGAFSMSPLSSPFTSSVVIFFQRQYGSLRLYKKNYGEVGGGGQTSPLPDTAHTEAEGTHCLPPGTPSLPWRLSHLHRWPVIYPDALSRSACHMGIPQLQIFIPFNF